MAPEGVIELLREFHGRMARAVFAHGGTLHKFLGDGFMASFGVTAPGRGATRPPAALALDCLEDIHGVMAVWNAERQARNETPLTLAVGLHFGPVVAGDIGDARCLEFAILGDTVNVASRLESLCRPLDAAAVISADVVAQVPSHPVLRAFQATTEATGLRGRAEPVQVFMLPRDVRF
jgi:adenylate cyclase